MKINTTGLEVEWDGNDKLESMRRDFAQRINPGPRKFDRYDAIMYAVMGVVLGLCIVKYF